MKTPNIVFVNLHTYGYAIDRAYAPIDLFIVCDGHGGSAVSKFIIKELKFILMDNRRKYPLPHNQIIKIFNNIQKQLLEHPQNIAKECGSTCLVVVRYLAAGNKKCIQVINLGDSRLVLCRNGLAMPLTRDHKPYWPYEKHRIDRVNEQWGTKQKIHHDGADWRIGDLSVSRAFGDLDNTPFVVHKPDIFEYVLSYKDEFLIMACDGVWDVLENHEAVNFVRDCLYDNHTEFYDIPHKYPSKGLVRESNLALKLATYVIARGSTDNVSIIIIYLGQNTNYS